MLVDVITAYVDGATAEGYAEDWDLETLWQALKTLYPVGIDHHDLLDSDAVGEPGDLTRDELLDALIADAERAYAEREKQLEEIAGDGALRQLERTVLLNVVDRKWREHLYEMDYLKEGIGMRQLAQRDPVVEYQREGYDMFVGMLDGVKEECVGFLFNVTVEAAPAPTVAPVATPAGLAEFAAAAAAKAQEGGVATKERPAATPAPLRAKGIEDKPPPLTYTGPSEDGSAQVQGSGAGPRHATPAGGSRRERREAARRQAKATRRRG
jgi:preprotein translocase subunit SecA